MVSPSKEIITGQSVTLDLKKAGTATLRFSPEYNPAVSVVHKIIVFDPMKLDGFAVVDEEGNESETLSFPFGENMRLRTKTSDGYKGLTYTYTITDSEGASYTLKSQKPNADSVPPGEKEIREEDLTDWTGADGGKVPVGKYALEVSVTNEYDSYSYAHMWTYYTDEVSDTLTASIEEFEVVKAPAPVLADAAREYVFGFADEGSMDIAALLSADRGGTKYTLVYEDNDGILDPEKTSVNEDGLLTFGVKAETRIGQQAVLTVTAVSDNYEDAVQKMVISIRDKYPLKAAEGKEPAVEGSLVYGQPLSALAFDQEKIAFVTEDGSEMPGTIGWTAPETVPQPGNAQMQEWTFVPEDPKYQTLTGELPVDVAKATLKDLPELSEELTYSPVRTLEMISRKYQEGLFASSEVTGETVSGTVIFKEPETVPAVTDQSFAAVFVPDREDLYERADLNVTFTVSRATPYFVGKGSASGLVYGQTLADSVISDIAALCDEVNVAGTFSFAKPEIKPSVKDGADADAVLYEVIFMPDDEDNYNAVTQTPFVTSLPVPVSKAKAGLAVDHLDRVKVQGSRTWTDKIAQYLPEDHGLSAKYAVKEWTVGVIGDAELNEEEGSVTITTDAAAQPGQSDDVQIVITTDNYLDILFTIHVTITDKYPVVPGTEGGPQAEGTLYYGQPLEKLPFAKDSTVFVSEEEDDVTVPGALSWAEPDDVLLPGTTQCDWVFTPDSDEYAAATGSASVTVKKAPLEGIKTKELEFAYADKLVYDPTRTLALINAGDGAQIIARSAITGEEVAGSVEWADKETVPTVDVSSYAGTFIPSGKKESLFESTPATVIITIVKAEPAVSAPETPSEITYGQTLNEAALPKVTAYVKGAGGNTEITGHLVWGEDGDKPVGSFKPNASDEVQYFPVRFIPDDQVNILDTDEASDGSSLKAGVLVAKKDAPDNVPEKEMHISHEKTKVEQVQLPDGWAWIADDAQKELELGAVVEAEAVYEAEDASNYVKVQQTVQLIVDSHSWDEGEVVKEPTTEEPGIRRFTCTICLQTRDEEIEKLSETAPASETAPETEPGPQAPPEVSQTGFTGPVGENASADEAQRLLETMPGSRDDLDGMSFSILQARCTKVKKNQLTIKWKKVPGAVQYRLVGNRCGQKYKYLTTVGGNTYTWKKLEKGKYYKFIVMAVRADHKIIATSKSIHTATKGGRVGNDKKVTVNKKKKTLKKGKTFKIKASAVPASSKLKVKRHRKVAFESSDPKVATVSKKGLVKAKGKGTCTIYCYAQNGVFAKVKITVKEK